MLRTVFGDNAMRRTQTSDWSSRSKRVVTSAEGCNRSGSTHENVLKVRTIACEDWSSAISEVAGDYIYHLEHSREFWRTAATCGISLRSLSPDCHSMSTSSGEFCPLKSGVWSPTLYSPHSAPCHVFSLSLKFRTDHRPSYSGAACSGTNSEGTTTGNQIWTQSGNAWIRPRAVVSCAILQPAWRGGGFERRHNRTLPSGNAGAVNPNKKRLWPASHDVTAR